MQMYLEIVHDIVIQKTPQLDNYHTVTLAAILQTSHIHKTRVAHIVVRIIVSISEYAGSMHPDLPQLIGKVIVWGIVP